MGLVGGSDEELIDGAPPYSSLLSGLPAPYLESMSSTQILEDGPLPEGVALDVLLISPDGGKVAYSAARGQKNVVRVGDAESEPFDEVGKPKFSPDGSTVAYWAKRGKREYMVVGTKKGKAFQGVGWPTWGPRGALPAFYVLSGRSQILVADGEQGEAFDCVSGTPTFSPDGALVAYSARKGAKWFIVAGKRKSEAYDQVSEPVFSKTGEAVIFAAVVDRRLLRVRMTV